MAQRKLQTVLRDLSLSLRESRDLASDAYHWSTPGGAASRPHISVQRRDSLIELAFLKAFLAWEVFLEESFVLYLVGQGSPRGRAPRRFAFPPNLRAAKEWVIPEERSFAKWTDPKRVSERAERFFRNGLPFSPVLRGSQNALDEARTIRNAVAHVSSSARDNFERLVRTKLGTLPPRMTIGGFLGTTMPHGGGPITFLENYVSHIELMARRIIP